MTKSLRSWAAKLLSDEVKELHERIGHVERAVDLMDEELGEINRELSEVQEEASEYRLRLTEIGELAEDVDPDEADDAKGRLFEAGMIARASMLY